MKESGGPEKMRQWSSTCDEGSAGEEERGECNDPGH